MTTEARPWPLDFAALRKGQILSEEELTVATGVEPADVDKRQLALLRLKQQIQLRRPDLQPTIRHKTIRILMDNEIADYAAGRMIDSMRCQEGALRALSTADYSALTSEEQKRVERVTIATNAVTEQTRQAFAKQALVLRLAK